MSTKGYQEIMTYMQKSFNLQIAKGSDSHKQKKVL